MLTSNQWGAIDEYLKLGITITEIAQRVGVSKPTIYERKKELNGQKIKTKSVAKKENERIKKYEPFIKRALSLRVTNMKVMYKIVKREGYKFTYHTFLRDIKKRKQQSGWRVVKSIENQVRSFLTFLDVLGLKFFCALPIMLDQKEK